MVVSYPSGHCCATYAMCVLASCAGNMEELSTKGVLGVLTTVPNNSSLGENFRLGSMQVFNANTAVFKCSGHVLGSKSHVILLYSSSPRPGAQICFKMCNKILFVPSTRLFIHGEYADMICDLHPHDLQKAFTGSQSKWVPPSDMKTSDAMKLWNIHSSVAMVVFELPAVLNACTHICCENTSR